MFIVQWSHAEAQAGYDGEENLAWLEEHGYRSCIKPSSYEKEKTRKWKNDIGRVENMRYDEDTDTFLCASGKRLLFKGVRRQKTGTGHYLAPPSLIKPFLGPGTAPLTPIKLSSTEI